MEEKVERIESAMETTGLRLLRSTRAWINQEGGLRGFSGILNRRLSDIRLFLAVNVSHESIER
jgi:hypothetical protein